VFEQEDAMTITHPAYSFSQHTHMLTDILHVEQTCTCSRFSLSSGETDLHVIKTISARA